VAQGLRPWSDSWPRGSSLAGSSYSTRRSVYAQNLGKLSIPQSEYHQRRLDRLHRRYLSSVKSLAQIRKMGPAVQINIAEKQINTAR
jgi:hypothetical protein